MAPDGSVHAERSPELAEGCVCGFATSQPAELDARLPAVFSREGFGRDACHTANPGRLRSARKLNDIERAINLQT